MNIEPFKLERYFEQYEFTAPYLLCSSDCESFSVRQIFDLEPESAARFEELWLGYTETQGSPELRAEITGLYRNIGAEQILVHAGAEEAIFNFVNAVLSPNDHVIVHFPCYQSLASVAQAAGCQVTLWPTREADGWKLDLDFLRDNLQPNTRAVIVNTPHNPTGYLMSRADQQALVEIARAHNLILFFDEVYRGMELDPADRLPAVCDVYENGVSLGVMSKTYGLAGLRIGWIATQNAEIYRALAAFKDYTTICNSAPSEFLATLALRHREQIVARNLDIIRHNLSILNPFFTRHADKFRWTPPAAGSIAFPRLTLNTPIEDFCAGLVEQQGVLLLPAKYYDFDGNHFRIGFGRKNMPQAVERLEAYLHNELPTLPL
ncbi:MAG: aminotransferase class I/II-fold pyridoxal phosphate-dependent enzyme [Chloroflexi bacterium]|nr:MAG: aminotransferase class I/II-fold pyridoxal phosphate-dependent enzyme [Chloroflexota bacterium]